MPWEYVRLVLCRDVFHCTPSQLAREDPLVVLETLEVFGAEASVRRVLMRKW